MAEKKKRITLKKKIRLFGMTITNVGWFSLMYSWWVISQPVSFLGFISVFLITAGDILLIMAED